jgi:hypothetical protein
MMKYGSKLQFEAPDKCPENCLYKDDIRNYGQNAICRYCPIFACTPVPAPEGGGTICMVEPEGFRDDWAEEWARYFKDGTPPTLRFEITKKEDSDGKG